jgi:hypothetical protein
VQHVKVSAEDGDCRGTTPCSRINCFSLQSGIVTKLRAGQLRFDDRNWLGSPSPSTLQDCCSVQPASKPVGTRGKEAVT